MKSATDLKSILHSIDHKGYPGYKSLQGKYNFERFTLSIDHVQGDPFASPSKVSILIPGNFALFPAKLINNTPSRIALEDHLLRGFYSWIQKYNFKAKGSGKSGYLGVSKCGQEILERSACTLNPADGSLLIRMEIGFPANGRTINASELAKILFDYLPVCIQKSFYYHNLNADSCVKVKNLCEDQEFIRKELSTRNLTAFVANGSLLPRASGISDKPMKNAIPFVSPDSLKVTLNLPHHGPITGMGIPAGVTLIVGGGFHGKSTLLKALEAGVYNHIDGDGREFVITDASAVKLRAEDSRMIYNVDISMFINHLPNGKDTTCFTTQDASGSTSQAANVIEAMEAGSQLFLIDEDTSATNFMIRDELMQLVVADKEEPITPFICRVRDLFLESGISSVIVAGSSGSYFHVADTIIQMREYHPYEITQAAKTEALNYPKVKAASDACQQPSFDRRPRPGKELKSTDRMKIKVMGKEAVTLNRTQIDLRYVEQLADSEQLAALAYALRYSVNHLMNGKRTITEIVDNLEMTLDKKGLAALAETSYLPCNFCRPRRQELFACLNRCRDMI